MQMPDSGKFLPSSAGRNIDKRLVFDDLPWERHLH